MLLYRNGAASGLPNVPPWVDDPLAVALGTAVVAGAIAELVGKPPDVAGTPRLTAPVPGDPPRLWAATSRHPSSPAPQINTAHVVFHDAEFMATPSFRNPSRARSAIETEFGRPAKGPRTVPRRVGAT